MRPNFTSTIITVTVMIRIMLLNVHWLVYMSSADPLPVCNPSTSLFSSWPGFLPECAFLADLWFVLVFCISYQTGMIHGAICYIQKSIKQKCLHFPLSLRSLFSRKSKESKVLPHNATGWRLFGRATAREIPSRTDSASTPSTNQQVCS